MRSCPSIIIEMKDPPVLVASHLQVQTYQWLWSVRFNTAGLIPTLTFPC